jgi:hypothetical protein
VVLLPDLSWSFSQPRPCASNHERTQIKGRMRMTGMRCGIPKEENSREKRGVWVSLNYHSSPQAELTARTGSVPGAQRACCLNCCSVRALHSSIKPCRPPRGARPLVVSQTRSLKLSLPATLRATPESQHTHKRWMQAQAHGLSTASSYIAKGPGSNITLKFTQGFGRSGLRHSDQYVHAQDAGVSSPCSIVSLHQRTAEDPQHGKR